MSKSFGVESVIRRLVITALCFGVCASSAFSQGDQPQVNRDPDSVRFITSDIDNFWRAYDLAAKESDRARKVAVYQSEYLDKGSAGLRDFVRLRIKSAENLLKSIERLPRYYASVRPGTLRVAEMEKKTRKSFHTLVAGFGLLKRKRWARIAGIIGAVMAAANFPIGTAVCVYAFWFLMGDSGKSLYDGQKIKPQDYFPPHNWQGYPPPSLWSDQTGGEAELNDRRRRERGE